MKKLLSILFPLVSNILLTAQAPLAFNYQVAIRDVNGDVLANTNVTMKFTIQTSATVLSTIKYQETQALVTNEFGLINCVIGNGTIVQGTMATVDWTSGTRFLKIETDLGAGFVLMGIQQMLSVPYALSTLNAPNTWGTSGNVGTNPGTNFIGTTDNTALNFRVNNEKAGTIDPTGGNVFLGFESGENNTFLNNTYIGHQAGKNISDGYSNTAIGYHALTNSIESIDNVAIGLEALAGGGFRTVAIGAYAGYDAIDTGGSENVLIGFSAGFNNRHGGRDVIIGFEAGYQNGMEGEFGPSGGSRNVFVGYQSGYSNIGFAEDGDGEDNTFVGYQSGYNNQGEGFGGANNTFMGSSSGYNNEKGNANSFFGYNAGFWNEDGDNNTFLGTYSGQENTFGSNNTFVGIHAGSSNTTSSSNTFIGSYCGMGNFSGSGNTFLGMAAGDENISGSLNTFIGKDSGGFNETGGTNTFVGAETGYTNTSGEANTFVGFDAGTANSDGNYNTFLGSQSGMENNSGSENTFVGRNSGVNNSTASHNTALGFDAGGSQTTGGDCTFLGYSAEASSGTFTNATAIGYQAAVTASNRVRIGNGSITQIGGQVGWSTLSDARLKQNIEPSSLGLSFITKLNPVSYNYIEGNTEIRYTGFLAQDVEKILIEMGEDFSGITKPENETDYYSIRYAEFVMPLVNAVQEQQIQIEKLNSENASLKSQVDDLEELKREFEQLKQLVQNLTTNN